MTNVPMKACAPRHDGWTELRKKTFLAVLRESGCVRDGCRVAGMSTTSAYRLRKRDPAVAARWAEAQANAQRGLIAVAHERAVVGRETIIIRKGEEVERRITPSDSILALLIKRGQLSEQDADRLISWDEWQDGVRFDAEGRKISQQDEAAAVRASLEAKLGTMRMKLLARRAKAEERLQDAEARAAALEGKDGPAVMGRVGKVSRLRST